MKKTNKKPKILIIRDEYINQRFCERYDVFKKDFDIVFLAPENHVNKIDTNRINLLTLPTTTQPYEKKLSKTPGVSRMIPHVLKKRFLNFTDIVKDFDIVQVEETFNWYTIQAAEEKRSHGYVLVCTVWENIPYIKDKRTLYQNGLFNGVLAKVLTTPEIQKRRLSQDDKIRRLMQENVDLFVTTSIRAKEMLQIEGYDPKRIEVSMPAVEINIFSPQPKDIKLMKRYGIKKDDVVVGSIGRMVWEKGRYDLLYAAKLLLEDASLNQFSLKFFFMGDGPIKADLMHLAKKMGIQQHIIIEKFMPYDQVPKYHNLFDIFVLNSIPVPYWQEQIGMVFIEAMASGKPVIAGESGSIPEVVGDAALLAQPGDFHDIYEKVKMLITCTGMMEKYQNKSRERAEKIFSLQRFYNENKEIYLSLLQKQ